MLEVAPGIDDPRRVLLMRADTVVRLLAARARRMRRAERQQANRSTQLRPGVTRQRVESMEALRGLLKRAK